MLPLPLCHLLQHPGQALAMLSTADTFSLKSKAVIEGGIVYSLQRKLNPHPQKNGQVLRACGDNHTTFVPVLSLESKSFIPSVESNRRRCLLPFQVIFFKVQKVSELLQSCPLIIPLSHAPLLQLSDPHPCCPICPNPDPHNFNALEPLTPTTLFTHPVTTRRQRNACQPLNF